MACPNLTGVFDCNENGIVKINVVDKGYEFVEDNQIKFVPTDSKSYELDATSTYMGFCQEKTFHIRINSINESVGPLTIETAFFIDSDNNLGQIGGLKYMVDGKEQVFPYASICKRINEQ